MEHAHTTLWTAPQPMWPTGAALASAAAGAEGLCAALRRPAVLRFVLESPQGDFMSTFQALLSTEPARVQELDAHEASAPGEAATLFQPARGRLYLVAASLVCQMPGLPDHRVDAASHERAGFVVRRLTATAEEAWVTARWCPLGTAERSALAPDEHVWWSMFPVVFEAGGRKRRLYAALVPTVRQDALGLAAASARGVLDPRLFEMDRKMLSRISRLPTPPARATERLGPDGSREVLLQLANFLSVRLPEVWAALEAGAGGTPGGGRLLVLLREAATAQGGPSWASALQTVWRERTLVDRKAPDVSGLQVDLSEGALEPAELWDALAEELAGVPVPEGFARTQLWGAQPRYVVRCVHRRRAASPGAAETVSEPSRPFRLAGFFDEEESIPGRPVAPAEVG
jgi:hypothetical protein